jgi:hypothetical protein
LHQGVSVTVTFTFGDGREKTFVKVESITHPSERLVVLHFEEGHSYPSDEVYIGLDKDTLEFKVKV